MKRPGYITMVDNMGAAGRATSSAAAAKRMLRSFAGVSRRIIAWRSAPMYGVLVNISWLTIDGAAIVVILPRMIAS